MTSETVVSMFEQVRPHVITGVDYSEFLFKMKRQRTKECASARKRRAASTDTDKFATKDPQSHTGTGAQHIVYMQSRVVRIGRGSATMLANTHIS